MDVDGEQQVCYRQNRQVCSRLPGRPEDLWSSHIRNKQAEDAVNGKGVRVSNAVSRGPLV